MRLLVFIIVVLLLAYALWPQPAPVPVEETFIGDQIQPLRKAEKFQQEDYNKALDEHRKNMDAQADEGGQ